MGWLLILVNKTQYKNKKTNETYRWSIPIPVKRLALPERLSDQRQTTA
jgi:hypothetical protein